jgi:hypothetical protein
LILWAVALFGIFAKSNAVVAPMASCAACICFRHNAYFVAERGLNFPFSANNSHVLGKTTSVSVGTGGQHLPHRIAGQGIIGETSRSVLREARRQKQHAPP